MSTEALERAVESTKVVLAKVDPDRLGDPTPCGSWDMRALINHVVGGMHWFHAQMAGADAEPGGAERDFTATDFVAAYADAAKLAVVDFQAPGATERMVTLPFGTMPGAAVLGLATMDTFQHGWDLARATGQPTDLDPEIAAQLLVQARATIPDQMRGPDGSGAPFGAAVEVPDTAPVADQLAGFLGRQV